MRKKTFLLLSLQFSLFLLLCLSTKAQDVNLTTQAQVDAFNQTSVAGNLTIFGPSISNLNGLSELQSVGVSLEITNTAITNIDGLSALQSIGHSLRVQGNSLLTNLNGFSSLTSVARGIYFLNNRVLTNYDGLLSLTSTIEGIRVSTCPIVNLNGFSNVFDITGFIELEDNPNLVNMDGLEGIQAAGVVNTIKINNNVLLQNINGLSSITDAGGVTIKGNNILPNLDGLANLQAAVDIVIEGNTALNNIGGLSGVQTLTGSLWIRSNSSLVNIDGVSGLTSIGKELLIDFNSGITNIDGLGNVTSIGTNLIIAGNAHLLNLNGLQNLTTVGKDLKVINNTRLVDFCGLSKLFDQGTIGGIVEIKNNGANTVSITPTDVTVNADPGVCSAVISTIGTPTIDGCLNPGTPTHTDFPAGNIYPVGTTNITWSVTDGADNTATAVQVITVVDNQPPVITCPADITVSCASDVPAVDINSVTVTDNCSALVTHVSDDTTNKTCLNRFTLTRTYMATDGAGNTATCSQVITVYDNTPPQITGLNVSQSVLWPPNHTMRDITVSYDVSDNCDNLDTTISISSNESINGTGDGDTDPDWEIVDKRHIRLRAERAANGDGRVYTITITVTDGCNSPVTATTNVTVAHNITGPVTGHPFRIGSTVDFAGTFWDKPGNKHTATWLIDDNTTVKGSVTEPAGAKNGKAFGSYKFTTAGVYKLQMNITDQNKITSYANTNGDVEEIIVVYDPNGGYTYGGGWFNSPAGALKSDPSATGKVSYGFTTNYFKNSTYPKGETQFEFKVGSLEFDALNFDYLVINGAEAQFKGTGKITGDQSGYAFIMTVIDGDLDGSGIDKIRMKIYNKNNGKVIYDNQPGASDAANPVAAVGLNSSITISGSNTVTTRVKPDAITESANQLEVLAIPNPSNTNFTLKLRSGNTNEKITVQVIDIYGRTIEVKNVNANQTLSLGDTYRPGTYIVKFIQGKEHKEIKLIKLPN
jgi:hypothetical protein